MLTEVKHTDSDNGILWQEKQVLDYYSGKAQSAQS